MAKRFEGVKCKCGKKTPFSGYVYAHWDNRLKFTCPCGSQYKVESGSVTPLKKKNPPKKSQEEYYKRTLKWILNNKDRYKSKAAWAKEVAKYTKIVNRLKQIRGNPPRRYKGEDSYEGPKYKGKKVVIYDEIESIEAKKGKNSLWPREKFRHKFKSRSKAEVLGNPDGSLLIRSKDGKPLHKLFDY